jgi:polycystin 1L2
MAMFLISKQCPSIGGLLCCTRGATLEFHIQTEERWLQIIHDPNAEHWVLVAYGFLGLKTDLLVYDSLVFQPETRQHIIACARKLSPASNTLTSRLCQKQEDGYNCGVFAIALANDLDPSSLVFDVKKMRSHLTECFTKRQLTPFPTTSITKSTRSSRLHKTFNI